MVDKVNFMHYQFLNIDCLLTCYFGTTKATELLDETKIKHNEKQRTKIKHKWDNDVHDVLLWRLN